MYTYPIGRSPIEIKSKIRLLLYMVIIILWDKIKITTNYEISYFCFNFDWKSTLYLKTHQIFTNCWLGVKKSSQDEENVKINFHS